MMRAGRICFHGKSTLYAPEGMLVRFESTHDRNLDWLPSVPVVALFPIRQGHSYRYPVAEALQTLYTRE